MTVKRIREGLRKVDDFLSNASQHQWAEQHHKSGKPVSYEAGPELGRLSDSMLIAMFQELDNILYEHREEIEKEDAVYGM